MGHTKPGVNFSFTVLTHWLSRDSSSALSSSLYAKLDGEGFYTGWGNRGCISQEFKPFNFNLKEYLIIFVLSHLKSCRDDNINGIME